METLKQACAAIWQSVHRRVASSLQPAKGRLQSLQLQLRQVKHPTQPLPVNPGSQTAPGDENALALVLTDDQAASHADGGPMTKAKRRKGRRHACPSSITSQVSAVINTAAEQGLKLALAQPNLSSHAQYQAVERGV